MITYVKNAAINAKLNDPKFMLDLWVWIADCWGWMTEPLETSEVLAAAPKAELFKGLAPRYRDDVIRAALVVMADSDKYPITKVKRGAYTFDT